VTLHWERLCSWCGHPIHHDTCPRNIQTGSRKARPTAAPCPCKQHEKKAQQE